MNAQRITATHVELSRSEMCRCMPMVFTMCQQR